MKVFLFLQILLLALFGVLFLAPDQSHAESNGQGVYINEIMWEGSHSSFYDKWIELYNDSNEIVDLSGWSLASDCSSDQTVFAEIPNEKYIAPKQYFLISHNEKDANYTGDHQSILNIDPDVVDSRFHYNKSHLKIYLCNHGRESIDYIGDGRSFFPTKNPQTSAYRTVFDLNSGDKINSWGFSSDILAREHLDPNSAEYATPQNSGTPKIDSIGLSSNAFERGSDFNLSFAYNVSDQQNDLEKVTVDLRDNDQIISTLSYPFGQTNFSFSAQDFCPKVSIRFIDQNGLFTKQNFDLTCYQKSAQIKFYEVLPHPSKIDWNHDGANNTKDEWIELVNFSGEKINLEGWIIKDESGKSYVINNQDIAPEGFLTIYGLESKISINDSGETLYLLDPSGKTVDLLKIPSSSSKKDTSFALWGSRWHWTNTPTPGAVNIISQSSSTKSLNPQDEIEGKKIILNGTIIDVDRTTVCLKVSNQIIEIKLKDDPSGLMAGQDVSVNATIFNNSSPILVAASSDFKIKKSASASSSNKSVSPGQMSESQTTIIKKIIKHNSKITLKSNYRLKPLVLSSQTERGSPSVNYQRFLLLFIGILSFMIIILLYDFYCRE